MSLGRKKTPATASQGFLTVWAFGCLQHTFALGLFTSQLAGTTNRFCLFTGFLLGRLLKMLPKLHFAEYAFALQLFLQSAERLIDIVVANTDLHVVFTTFLDWSCKDLQEVAV